MKLSHLILCLMISLPLIACGGSTPEEACDNYFSVCSLDELDADGTIKSACVSALESGDDQEVNDCLADAATCEDIASCGYSSGI